MDQKNLGNHIWNVAELLRGDFKQSEYGLIILPFAVLRRFECVLEPTREAVRKKMAEIADLGIDPDLVLPEVSGQQFYNTSRYQLDNLGVADTLANLECQQQRTLTAFCQFRLSGFHQFSVSSISRLMSAVSSCGGVVPGMRPALAAPQSRYSIKRRPKRWISKP